jgi:hypothetical protein
MTTSRQMVCGGSEARKAGHRSQAAPLAGNRPRCVSLGHFTPPVVGNGAIPAYGTWEQAHSTTLEIASEMGVPFTILVIAGWLGVFIVLGRAMTARRRDEILPAAAFWIGLLAVLRSLVDFSLRIPGFSLAILPLVGMGLAQSKSSKSPTLNTGTGFNRSRGSGTIQFAEFHLNP